MQKYAAFYELVSMLISICNASFSFWVLVSKIFVGFNAIMFRITQLDFDTFCYISCADYMFCTDNLVTRSCSACVSHDMFCVVSDISDVCAKYTCFHWSCKLASS